MGNETTRTTQKVIVQALIEKSEESIESEKEKDDALTGLPAVRDAITNNQISLKTFTDTKFHAKMYLMDAKEPSPVDFAIVGSSNFTKPGLCENIELNLFTTDQAHINGLSKWYNDLCEALVNCRIAGLEPDIKLNKWIEIMPDSLLKKFVSWGLIDGQRTEITKPLTEHISDYVEILEAKGYSKDYVVRT